MSSAFVVSMFLNYCLKTLSFKKKLASDRSVSRLIEKLWKNTISHSSKFNLSIQTVEMKIFRVYNAVHANCHSRGNRPYQCVRKFIIHFLLYFKVQEARQNHDDESVKKAVNEYDEALERFVGFVN